MSLPPGTRLGAYEILAPLGAGGMGAVYRARDPRLGREVAIKIIASDSRPHPELLRRFEDEARAAAALNHPCILAVFDVGCEGDSPYVVFELLEGETLRTRLLRGRPQPAKAVEYAVQICLGLAAAHAKGIIHRDLKPENVFLTCDGRVKILDFGLAKLTHGLDSSDMSDRQTRTATKPGVVMGTFPYMSPEQVKGRPADHRSDIFSFGSVLYEMLSGRMAFGRGTSAETAATILAGEPPPLSERGERILVALDHVVRRCLEKDPEDRFQSAKDVAFALTEGLSPRVTGSTRVVSTRGLSKEFLAVALSAVVVLAISGTFLLRTPRKEETVVSVKRVAVLPFENLGSPEDEYFADGITDEVRGKLTSLTALEVIARGSSMPYKKTTKSPLQIAEELDARYLLTATVRWQKVDGASRVHVAAELVEVSGATAPTSKWQQPFDAALTNVFQVQSDIATRVAKELDIALGTDERNRLAATSTQDLAAYDAFLKGEQASDNMGTNDLLKLRPASAFYERAVALDPDFAHAWAQLARTNAYLYMVGTATPSVAERARQASERAVALAPHHSVGYLARGDYQRLVVGNFNRAVEEYDRGLQHAPGDADLVTAIAQVNQSLARWDGAIDRLRQAERLDPRSVPTKLWLGAALLYLRRYPEARDAADRGLALAPASLTLIQQEVLTFVAQGDLAEARAVLRAKHGAVEPTALVAYVAANQDLVWVLDAEQRNLLLRLTPSAFDDNKGVWGLCLAQAHALNGNPARATVHAEAAKQAYEEQVRTSPQDARRRVLLGVALAYLGRKSDAIREGERAAALRPVHQDAFVGPIVQRELVRIYILVGEPEKALDRLEALLRIPSLLSAGWLRIDPNFDPLRKNPRFQRLVAQGK